MIIMGIIIQALCEIAIIILTIYAMWINNAPAWAAIMVFNLFCFAEVVSVRLECKHDKY
jgi:hypothetical protein